MAKSQKKAGMILSYTGTLLHIAVNILLTPFLIRSLGDAEYGVYQMMSSFAGYLVLMNFGTGSVMTRYVSMYLGKKDKEGERNFIAMCLMVTGGLVVLIVSVAAVMYFCIDDIYASSLTLYQIEKAKQLFIFIAANLVFSLIAQSFQGIINAYERFKFVNGWSAVKTLLKALLLILLFMFKADSLTIVLVDLSLTVLYMVMCSVYAFVILKATPKLCKFDKQIFVSSAVFSLAIMMQAVVGQANTKVDSTILGIMIGPESVTVYSVAMQIFTVFSSLSMAATAIYLPQFTKMVAKGEGSGKQLTKAMIAPSRVQALVSGSIMFGFLICGRDFVRVWMGEGYELVWVIAVVAMVPMFFVYTNSMIESALYAMQKWHVYSVVMVVAAIFNVLLSIVLVKYFGELGAITGTAVTSVIGSGIVMNIYYKKVIGIDLKQLFGGIFKGLLLSFLVAFLVTLPIAVIVPVGLVGLLIKGLVFVIVLCVCLMTFGLNKDEKALLCSFVKKEEVNKPMQQKSTPDSTEILFIELLRGFATGSTPQLDADGVDTQRLLMLAKRHSVQGIVAHMVKSCNLTLTEEATTALTKAYDRTVMQMVHREGSALALCRKLSESNIPHILFKGLTVSECYPVKELRTYGDVDILTRKEDVRAVREMMISMGFEHSIADKGVVNAYVKGREHYEFHTALNVSTIKNDETFSRIWEHTVPRMGETRVFEHNFHLCYLISHVEKHVYGSGAGIKMYLDIALYIEKYRENIDLLKVREILSGCGLEKFLNTVLCLCRRWFSLDIPEWTEELPEETYEQMCEFTLSGGIFGTENNLTSSLRRELSTGTKGAKLRVFLNRVFPSYYELCRIYPRYQGKPLLVPVAWVNHIYRVIKDRKLGRIKEIASINVKEAENKNKFFESIGAKR